MSEKQGLMALMNFGFKIPDVSLAELQAVIERRQAKVREGLPKFQEETDATTATLCPDVMFQDGKIVLAAHLFFEGPTDPDGFAADGICESIGPLTHFWTEDVGATDCWLENILSVTKEGKH
jgi:hypothetical protein